MPNKPPDEMTDEELLEAVEEWHILRTITNIADVWPLVENLQKIDRAHNLASEVFLAIIDNKPVKEVCRAICEAFVTAMREGASRFESALIEQAESALKQIREAGK